MHDLSPLLLCGAALLGLLSSQAPAGPLDCISPVTEQVCQCHHRCHCSHNVTVEAEVRADTPDSSSDVLWSTLAALGGAALSRCGLVLQLAWLCAWGPVGAVSALAHATWTSRWPSQPALEPQEILGLVQAETDIAARVRRDVERARQRSAHHGGNSGKFSRP